MIQQTVFKRKIRFLFTLHVLRGHNVIKIQQK